MMTSSPNHTPAPSPRGRGIAVAFTVVGLVIAGSGVAAAAASAARISDKQSDFLTADATGISRVEIDNSSATLNVVFADVDEASLDVQSTRSSGASAWNLSTRNDTLIVQHNNSWLSGIGFFGFFGEETVTLTLPEDLNDSLSLDLENSAGAAVVEGDFVAMSVQLNAGDIEIDGAVESLELAINAGSARLAVDDVSTLDVDVSAGSLRGSVSGAAPRTSSFSVSAGDINLTMPDETYRITSDVALGDSDIDLDTDSSAPRTITIDIAAGDITLRRGQ